MLNIENLKIKCLTRTFLLNRKQLITKYSTKFYYYFIIGSENFLLKEEPLEEVLRERFQYCLREKKLMNFWLIRSPQFINHLSLQFLEHRIPKYPILLVSTNDVFVRWLKLRYHHVGIGIFIPNLTKPMNPLV